MDVIDGAPGPINPGHRPELDDWAHFSVGGNEEVSESLEREALRLVSSHEQATTRRQHPDVLFGRSRPCGSILVNDRASIKPTAVRCEISVGRPDSGWLRMWSKAGLVAGREAYDRSEPPMTQIDVSEQQRMRRAQLGFAIGRRGGGVYERTLALLYREDRALAGRDADLAHRLGRDVGGPLLL